MVTSSLRILFTTLELNTRRGVQNVTRDLILGLIEAGHEVTAYARQGGPVAADLWGCGVRVELKVDALAGEEFDVIHGHHLVACSPVLARFPNVPALFVCHDDVSWFDAAPRLPNLVCYAAVSESMADRVARDAGIARTDVALLLNGVDTARFVPGPAPANPPRRALAFAKNSEHIAVIRAACSRRGIAVDFIGAAVEAQLDDPAQALPRYDLVFASALSAIEAMACQRPVIVCDGRGMAGMVDSARYEAWRPMNFGKAALNGPLSIERVLAEIDRFDPLEAARVGDRIRNEAGVGVWVEQCVALYRRAIAAPRVPLTEAAEMWARHLERWTPRLAEHWAFTDERQVLINEVRRLRAGLDALPLNNRITFGEDRASARFVDPNGFERTQGSMWTSSRFASLRFRPDVIGDDLDLDLEYATHLPDEGFAREIVVLANGAEIDRWTERGYAGWTEGRRRLRLPSDVCHPATSWLAFQFSQTAGGPPASAPAFCIRATTFRSGALSSGE